ncbi:MAG TPA: chemotaxis protein CheW, partial [Vicinamibacterales bacterium]|nr:chemotaxis protein CheW [Vicinamibacterales bacterium]
MTAPTTHATTLRDAIAAANERLDVAVSPEMAAAPTAATADARFVLLSIASSHYAVPEAFVTELERVPRVTMVPRVPAWLLGVTNLRGDIVSVIDLRAYLGLAPHASSTGRMLVVRLLDEPFATGLIVDAVDRIVTLRTDEVKAPASPLEGALAPFISGVCATRDRLVAVLDVNRLLRSPDIRQFDEPKS